MAEQESVTDPHFSIRYTFTYPNLTAFNAIHDAQPEGRRLLTVFLAILSVIAFGIVVLIENFRNTDKMDWRVWLTVAVVYGLLFWAFRFPAYRLIKKMLLPLFYSLRGYNKLIGAYQMDLSEDTLSVQSPLGTHIYGWDKIYKVIFEKDYLIFYITKMSGYAVPLSGAQFVAGSDVLALVAFVQDKVSSFHETKLK